MKSVPFLCLLLLSSCQSGPRVNVIINELKPGMLKGRTVGMEGMMITAANWPGKGIDAPILNAAEKTLRSGLKGAQVYVMNEEGMVIHGADAKPGKGASAGARLGASAKTPSKQPDYIFRIMLRSDSNSHRSSLGLDLDYMRLRNVNLVGGGTMSLMRNGTGFFSSSNSINPRRGVSPFSSGGYSWREITKRTLKADYILSDSQTCKILWRAEAIAVDQRVNVNNSVAGYRSPADLASEVPLRPLWIAMNTAAERAIKKSGTSSYQTVVLAGGHVIYP